MNIFNSLGSNYDFGFVLKTLFANNRPSHKENLIKFLEKKYGGRAILVYKGREAIELGLEVLKLPNESYIAINGFTCFAVYKAIETAGYTPVCLDLEQRFNNRHSGDDPPYGGEDSRISNHDKRFWTSQNDVNEVNNDFNLDFSANELLKAIKQNPKIKVVIVQNTLGYPCDIERITKICRENNLILIEDLAHCVGSKYKNGKEAGTVGDFTVLSFSQDKVIDAVSGGALIVRNKKYQDVILVTQSEAWRHPESPIIRKDSGQARMTTIGSKQQLIDRLYPLFTFIIRKTYSMEIGKIIHFFLKSFNLLSKPMNESFYEKCSLPNWYCSLVLYAFENLKVNLEHRRQIVDIYNSMLDKKITSDYINKNISISSNLRYPIFIGNRKDLINYLKKEGVHVSDIWYDDVDKSLPNCQVAANTILNLPTHRNVSDKDAKNISLKINQWLKSQ